MRKALTVALLTFVANSVLFAQQDCCCSVKLTSGYSFINVKFVDLNNKPLPLSLQDINATVSGSSNCTSTLNYPHLGCLYVGQESMFEKIAGVTGAFSFNPVYYCQHLRPDNSWPLELSSSCCEEPINPATNQKLSLTFGDIVGRQLTDTLYIKMKPINALGVEKELVATTYPFQIGDNIEVLDMKGVSVWKVKIESLQNFKYPQHMEGFYLLVVKNAQGSRTTKISVKR